MKYLIILILLSSCLKEELPAKSYKVNSADFLITKFNGDTLTLKLSSWTNFNLVQGNLTLVPNINCQTSIDSCKAVKIKEVLDVRINNQSSYKCQ